MTPSTWIIVRAIAEALVTIDTIGAIAMLYVFARR